MPKLPDEYESMYAVGKIFSREIYYTINWTYWFRQNSFIAFSYKAALASNYKIRKDEISKIAAYSLQK